jgi:hypothetical protein
MEAVGETLSVVTGGRPSTATSAMPLRTADRLAGDGREGIWFEMDVCAMSIWVQGGGRCACVPATGKRAIVTGAAPCWDLWTFVDFRVCQVEMRVCSRPVSLQEWGNSRRVTNDGGLQQHLRLTIFSPFTPHPKQLPSFGMFLLQLSETLFSPAGAF